MGIFTRFGWIRRLRSVVFGVRRFMQAPWAGGVVLLTCVAVAMLLANLPATALYYHHLLETELSAMVHSPEGVIDWIFPRGMTVEKFINDGLMVVFLGTQTLVPFIISTAAMCAGLILCFYVAFHKDNKDK